MFNVKKCVFSLLISSTILIVCSCTGGSTSSNSTNSGSNSPAMFNSKPAGVNFGGLFVLEDWFFASDGSTKYTPVPTQCPVPSTGKSTVFAKNLGSADFNWASETDLIRQYMQLGYTDEQIANFFQIHRDNYLLRETGDIKTLDDNFKKLKSLGITLVRLPVTWAIQYDHPYTLTGTNGFTVTIPASNAANSIQLIKDPFYPDLKWASIPVSQIENILTSAQKYGIKVVIDIHSYPGGSAGDNSYSGILPRVPKFWSANTPENFHTIFNTMILWAEGLAIKNPTAFQGLGGLSPMNEPAHLLGPRLNHETWPCDTAADWGLTSYQPVLDTLAISVKDFNNSTLSKLPDHSVKLYMNIIESIFDKGDPLQLIGNWWRGITSADDRRAWAVLDIHHYAAWDPENCLDPEKDANGNPITNANGIYKYKYLDKNTNGTYTINPAGFAFITQSAGWFTSLRSKLGLSTDGLLATSEFSASTRWNLWNSCTSGLAKDNKGNDMNITNSLPLRNSFLEAQTAAANSSSAKVALFFWTWMIPYNSNYRNEWDYYSICSSNNPPSFCN